MQLLIYWDFPANLDYKSVGAELECWARFSCCKLFMYFNKIISTENIFQIFLEMINLLIIWKIL